MLGPHRLFTDTTVHCDVVIIGSGAGGATVAQVLTQAGLDVVILEEGPMRPHELAPESVGEGFAELWRGGGLTAALGSPPVAYAEGRCVGGSTEINSAIMQRCPDELLDTWARDYQIDDFGADSLRPHYDAVGEIVNPSPTPQPLGTVSDLLVDGARKLGWKYTELLRAQRHCVGTNLCSIGCPTGGKQSMSSTAIRAALDRNLRLIAQCRVQKLRIRGNRVLGVDATSTDTQGRKLRVHVRADAVFACAGAIQTPALLRRSGIRSNVGNSLRLHPTLRVLAKFPRPIDAHLSRLPLVAITEFMPNQRIGGSIFLPGTFGMALAEFPSERDVLTGHWRECGLYYAMVRAQGVGSVRPILGLREPLVRYRLSNDDWRNLGEIAQRLFELMFAAGAIEVHPSVTGVKGITNLEQARRWLSNGLPRERTLLMSIHLFSSCPPGNERSRCATDSHGRVHGVTNLLIADASQIPEAPGVNPQLTVMAMAHRNVQAFLNSRNTGRAGRMIGPV